MKKGSLAELADTHDPPGEPKIDRCGLQLVVADTVEFCNNFRRRVIRLEVVRIDGKAAFFEFGELLAPYFDLFAAVFRQILFAFSHARLVSLTYYCDRST